MNNLKPVTFYQTQWQLYLIPYKMKRECQQAPLDLFCKYSHTWYQVKYDLLGLDLRVGEWDEAKINLEKYLADCEEKELEFKRNELRIVEREAKASINK